ncbi:MAG: DegT/DnrJ/EryC1/StrS family aminotransferase [Acidimicrobiia bacterium]
MGDEFRRGSERQTLSVRSRAYRETIDIDLRPYEPYLGLEAPWEEIPLVDLAAAHRPLIDEILAAWERILRRGSFVGGPEIEAFEAEFARYVGTSGSVAVANGTDALFLSLVAMGLQPGDEVVTVSHTFTATVQAIVRAGGRPVLVDVDPHTGTMDPDLVERAISPRTRVLLPVHLYGQTADMDPLLGIAERHGLQVLEDACQAHGAEYRGRRAGSMGRAAAFSFYPGKNLGACGDAGAVTTNDVDLANRIRMLRNHGESEKHSHEMVGVNSRLDVLQAAVLRIKLRQLDGWIEARRHWARRYHELLADTDFELPVEAPGRLHVYHLYVVRHPNRDAVRAELGKAGIRTGLHYPIPVHLQGGFRHLGLGRQAIPRSERWADHGLSLPMFPELTEDAVARVATVLVDATTLPHVPTRRPA